MRHNRLRQARIGPHVRHRHQRRQQQRHQIIFAVLHLFPVRFLSPSSSMAHAIKSCTTVVFSPYQICCPSLRLVIRSAPFNTLKWCDMAGFVISNFSASAPAVISPCRSSAKISRRVGSASARNASFPLNCCPALLHAFCLHLLGAPPAGALCGLLGFRTTTTYLSPLVIKQLLNYISSAYSVNPRHASFFVGSSNAGPHVFLFPVL